MRPLNTKALRKLKVKGVIGPEAASRDYVACCIASGYCEETGRISDGRRILADILEWAQLLGTRDGERVARINALMVGHASPWVQYAAASQLVFKFPDAQEARAEALQMLRRLKREAGLVSCYALVAYAQATGQPPEPNTDIDPFDPNPFRNQDPDAAYTEYGSPEAGRRRFAECAIAVGYCVDTGRTKLRAALETDLPRWLGLFANTEAERMRDLAQLMQSRAEPWVKHYSATFLAESPATDNATRAEALHALEGSAHKLQRLSAGIVRH